MILLQFNEEWYNKNRLVAWTREKLKGQGIVGLNEARYFCRLLERLPTLLQVQYTYEKVGTYITYLIATPHLPRELAHWLLISQILLRDIPLFSLTGFESVINQVS